MLSKLLMAANKLESLPYEQFQKLLASDGAASAQFGYSVSISGDGNVALVGAYGDADKGANAGSAYIFTKQADGSYQQASKLLASDGAAYDNFGRVVSISSDGNVALIGAYGDDDKGAYSGSAYIFAKQANGSYIQTSKLLARDGAASDYFGSAVSISSDGNVALVGTPGDDDKGAGSGSAYIFTKQADGAYIQTSKLLASDGAASGQLGYSVSISSDGNVALVGAHGDADKGANSGAVYTFAKQADGSYLQTIKLLASDGAANDYFGYSVSISGDGNVALIGAFGDADKGTNTGSVYIFTKQANGSYIQTSKLLASDGAAYDNFGRVVSISSDGNVALIGAYGDSTRGSGTGSAYIFAKQANGSYIQTSKLLARDGAAGDYFGFAVSISGDGNVALIGAYGDDDKGTDSGSAYIFA